MADIRTSIKNALLSRLQTVTFPTPVNGASTWVSTSRRLKVFAKVDATLQPAMYLVQHREEYVQGNRGTPAKRYLDMGCWCLAPTADESVIGDIYLDSMLAGIEAVMLPDQPQTNELTLGGLCYFCRIELQSGMFIRDPGDLDGQALLVVPIRICIP